MKARRVAVLVGKELVYGSKNLMFIFAVVIPLLFSLIISLLVGTLFAGKPRLGVADLGSSRSWTMWRHAYMTRRPRCGQMWNTAQWMLAWSYRRDLTPR
jgi:hypothetical protein